MQEKPAADDTLEVPTSASSQSNNPNPNQTLYDGEPLGMTPIFADTPAWLTDDTSAAIPIYHRRSTDGTAMRIMMEALAPAQGPTVRFEETTQDPLDTTPSTSHPTPMSASGSGVVHGVTPSNGDAAVAAAAGANAVVQQSPFGTLVLPNGNDPKAPAPAVEGSAIRLRRSTTIKPHWTQTPRILVVEDDVVYRQLSSKFLEKFGCITETVEDAQGAVEKMNATKYDLVLMDIFFGPSMDGYVDIAREMGSVDL
jgi:osomolarity two-component system response regulator SKN7